MNYINLFFLRVLLIACLLGFSISMYSQVSIKVDNLSLKETIKKIQSTSDYSFFYNESLSALKVKVTVNIKNQSINKVLDILLKNTGLTYTVRNEKQIVILEQNTKTPVTNERKRVNGVVKDGMGEFIIGATVKAKGTANGVVTDFEGKFSMDVEPNAVLEVSYIGFLPHEISVKGKTFLTIVMREDVKALEEVIVVGYGTQKKRDLTGAVSSVKTSDMEVATASSIDQMLAGKAAGLQVSLSSAQPGGASTFLIRGAASINAGNEPLIIIDGFPVTSFAEPGGGYYDGGSKSDLNSINPNDIESIEVLKDASSSAIYGARAANGVILITTKRGKEGRVSVNYKGTFSAQQITDNYDVMNATELMTAVNMFKREEWLRVNQIYPYGTNEMSDAEIASKYPERYSREIIENNKISTDWVGEVTRPGMINAHNLSVQAGTQKTKYFVSLGYYDVNGVIKNSGMKRYSGRINLDQDFNKYLKAGISLTYSKVINDNTQLGGMGAEASGIIRSAVTFPTFLNIKDENGNYVLSPYQAFLPNPVSLLEIKDQSSMERGFVNGYIQLEPIKGLKLKYNIGADRNIARRNTYLPNSTLYGAKTSGSASINYNEKLDFTTSAIATYDLKICDEHSLSLMAGFEYQKFDNRSSGMTNSNFITDSFLWNNIGSGEAEKPSVWSSGGVDKIASYFARVNYSLQDKYLVTASIRTDGSSKFSKNKRWAVFPSLALAWRVSEEKFMKNLKPYLSNLKFRVGLGQTGNANIANNAFAAYGIGVNGTNSYVFGNRLSKGVYASRLENMDLTWETTTELNIGLDFGFFNNRLSGSVEYFDKEIKDLLSTKSLMSYHEVNSVAANIGKTQSRGLELTLNTTNIDTRNFKWSTNLTFSFYRDRWKERDPNWKPNIYEKENAFIRNRYGYIADGLCQPGEKVPHMPGLEAGQVKIKDINGFLVDDQGNRVTDDKGRFIYSGKPDGKIDDADIFDFGCEDPYSFGFGNTFCYKNFDLNIYFYGMFDRLLEDPNVSLKYGHDLGNNQGGLVDIMNSWGRYNMNSKQPSLFPSSYGYGNYFWENAWFIRCKNITLGYNFSNKLIKKVCQKARVFVEVQNPFIITSYSGLDPETDTYVAAYPNVRTFTCGIDMTF